ncbi:MAG: tellurium resistance protein [Paracoccaceae bacterium]
MQASTGLWRQTPPAIFPPILGLLGLGLAWRRASQVFPVPSAVGEIILGAVSLLFLFAVLAYLGKFVRRPGALVDDLRIMPGRAGISAGSMSAMLFAAVLVPYSNCFGQSTLFVGMAAHLVIIAIVIGLLWSAPYAQRRMTPVWHLTFVGLIVAPQAGVALGLNQMSEFVMFLTGAGAITIWLGNLIGMSHNATPPPLRPTMVIHLAPVSLIGIAAMLLGYTTLAMVLAWLALVLAVVMLLRVGYLTAAGFSPFWGAFTFPMAAFTGLMLMMAQTQGGWFRIVAGVALIFITLVIPVIAYRIMKMWSSGMLAAKTNASKV